MHWRAALAGYSAGLTGEPLRRDTRRDPLASSSGRYWAGSTGQLLWRDTQRERSGGILGGTLGGIHWRAALADTGRDPLASCSGGILSASALAGYSAGSTGEPLWRDTQWDPLASRSGGILGGIHWRAALAGYWAGSTGEPLWRDTGWGGGVEASQTRIPTYNLTTPSYRVGNNTKTGGFPSRISFKAYKKNSPPPHFEKHYSPKAGESPPGPPPATQGSPARRPARCLRWEGGEGGGGGRI